MKFTAFVTSLFLVGSEAFAPGAGNARSSTGKFIMKQKSWHEHACKITNVMFYSSTFYTHDASFFLLLFDGL